MGNVAANLNVEFMGIHKSGVTRLVSIKIKRWLVKNNKKYESNPILTYYGFSCRKGTKNK